jgi:hypothetical protein
MTVPSEHDWHITSNRCARGIDWYVTKVGNKWAISDIRQGLATVSHLTCRRQSRFTGLRIVRTHGSGTG